MQQTLAKTNNIFTDPIILVKDLQL